MADMDGITSLSDVNLRLELVRFGFHPGPVTDTTRGILQKKLLKLRSEQKKAPKRASIPVPSRKVLGFSSDDSENDARPTGTNTRQASARRRSARGRLTSSTRRRSTKGAEEESENDSNNEDNIDNNLPSQNSFSFLNRSNRSKSTKLQPNDSHASNTQARLNRSGARLPHAFPESDLRPTPRSFSMTNNEEASSQSTKPKSSKRNSSIFSMQRLFRSQQANENEFSDSDIDHEGTSWKANKSQITGSMKNDWSVHNAKPNASYTKHSRLGVGGSPAEVNKTFDIGNENGDKENDVSSVRKRRSLNSTPKTSTPRKLTPHSYQRPDADGSLSSKPERRKRSDGSNQDGGDGISAGNRTSHSLLEQEFPTEENLSSSLGSKYSHVISTVLLACAFIFFAVLGVLYISVGNDEVPNDIRGKNLICGGSSYCGEQTSQDAIIAAAQLMSDKLSEKAGLFACGALEDGNMTKKDVVKYLEEQFAQDETKNSPHWAEDMLAKILKTSLENDWGIKLFNATRHQLTEESQVEMCVYISSQHATLPWFCRVRRSASLVLFRLTIILLFVVIAWILVLYLRYYWRQQEVERQQVHAMVEKILDMLAKHHRACQNDTKNNHAYQAIPHVRDSIIAPAERHKMQRVWSKAVQFINTHESRVRVERQRIEGEEFQVWRWVQASPPPPHLTSFAPVMELEYNPNRVKVWQGTAFDNPEAAVKMRSYSLTECLKIRNMFDISLESNEHWEVVIEDAVLERCGPENGIVHVAVDKNSTEGCVYVKFVSPEMAGKGFRKLHGSWFDGKLITVKFLRLERYHTRFPEATSAVSPIKPSNNLQKSLSVLNRPSVGGEAS